MVKKEKQNKAKHGVLTRGCHWGLKTGVGPKPRHQRLRASAPGVPRAVVAPCRTQGGGGNLGAQGLDGVLLCHFVCMAEGGELEFLLEAENRRQALVMRD